MKAIHKIVLVAALVASLATTILAAPKAVGIWKGKVQVDWSKIPNGSDPKVRAAAQKMIAGMSFSLNLKADKTYTITISNAPGGGGKSQTESGGWSQNGNQVTVTSKKNGKTDAQSMTISNDGKTMTLVPKGGMGGKVIFTR